MPLPKLTIPTYSLTIPSTKKKVKFRPFLSKEEKILMLVKQSENSEEILQAMRDIVDVCTFEKLNISSLALFDLEYIFLKLRGKSVGEIIDIDMKCNNQIEIPVMKVEDIGGGIVDPSSIITEVKTKSCGNLIPFSINIDDIKIDFSEKHTKVIKLEKEIGMTMRYPSVDDLGMLEDNKEDDVEIIKGLIESIYDKDNVYDISDTNPEDLQEFVDNLSSKQIESIRNDFFHTMPALSHTVKYKCTDCGFEGEYTFSGINDFF